MRLDHLLSMEKSLRAESKVSEEGNFFEGRTFKSEHCLILRVLEKGNSTVEKHSTKGRPEYGGVAQLGEHLPCKQGVDSSILFISTTVGAERSAVTETGWPKRHERPRIWAHSSGG